jgi:hypothetical protein
LQTSIIRTYALASRLRGQLDGGEGNEGGRGFGKVFEILGETSVLFAELTAIWIADATHEGMRDLVRAGATGPYWCCGCFIAP